MSDFDEFPFMNEFPEPDGPAFRLSPGHRDLYCKLGLKEADLDALECVVSDGGDLDLYRDAMLNFRNRGDRVLHDLEAMLENSVPAKSLGGDCLVSKARCDRQEFTLDNVLRPFYARLLIARLRAKGKKDEAKRITIKGSWVNRLVRAAWPPITTGEAE